VSGQPPPSPISGEPSASRFAKVVGTIVAVLILLAGAFALIWILVAILHLITGVPAEILVTIVTVLGGLLSVLVARYVEAANERHARLREKKVPIYESFLEAVVGQMMIIARATDAEKADATQRVVDQLTKLTPPLIIWASDDVLRTWSRYRRYDLLSGDPMRGVVRLELVLKAIRRDLGHRNSGLKVGDILGTYINDVDQTLK
jgi:membrane protein implicated in regulation of membrane protease activity